MHIFRPAQHVFLNNPFIDYISSLTISYKYIIHKDWFHSLLSLISLQPVILFLLYKFSAHTCAFCFVSYSLDLSKTIYLTSHLDIPLEPNEFTTVVNGYLFTQNLSVINSSARNGRVDPMWHFNIYNQLLTDPTLCKPNPATVSVRLIRFSKDVLYPQDSIQ